MGDYQVWERSVVWTTSNSEWIYEHQANPKGRNKSTFSEVKWQNTEVESLLFYPNYLIAMELFSLVAFVLLS